MMTINDNNRNKGQLGRRGFSLIELLVVLAILGILAAAVGYSVTTPDAKLKSYVFNLSSRFKQAKFEAMKSGRNVYLDFDFDGDGIISTYTIWVDNNDNGAYNAGVDQKIADAVAFESGVEVYDATSASITGGPKDPAGGSGGGEISEGLNAVDATGANVTSFTFKPGGDCVAAGSIYLYAPRSVAGGKKVLAGPFAIVLNAVGRARVDEWKNGKWQLQ